MDLRIQPVSWPLVWPLFISADGHRGPTYAARRLYILPPNPHPSATERHG